MGKRGDDPTRCNCHWGGHGHGYNDDGSLSNESRHCKGVRMREPIFNAESGAEVRVCEHCATLMVNASVPLGEAFTFCPVLEAP